MPIPTVETDGTIACLQTHRGSPLGIEQRFDGSCERRRVIGWIVQHPGFSDEPSQSGDVGGDDGQP